MSDVRCTPHKVRKALVPRLGTSKNSALLVWKKQVEVCDTHPWCPSPRPDVAAGRSITSDLEPATLPKTGTSSFSEEDLAAASMAGRCVLSVLKDFVCTVVKFCGQTQTWIKALIEIAGKAQTQARLAPPSGRGKSQCEWSAADKCE